MSSSFSVELTREGEFQILTNTAYQFEFNVPITLPNLLGSNIPPPPYYPPYNAIYSHQEAYTRVVKQLMIDILHKLFPPEMSENITDLINRADDHTIRQRWEGNVILSREDINLDTLERPVWKGW